MTRLPALISRGWRFAYRIWKTVTATSTPRLPRRLKRSIRHTAQSATEVLADRNEARGCFLDFGSNIGQGFEHFVQYFRPDSFDYFLFEPNPNCCNILRDKIELWQSWFPANGKIEIREEAVAGRSGTVRLFGLVEDKRGMLSDGASIIKEHNSIFYEPSEAEALAVQSVEAAHIIREFARKYSVIVIKMDIEGAEYDVLENVRDNNLRAACTHIYVEWHSGFLGQKHRSRALSREAALKEYFGNKITDWI